MSFCSFTRLALAYMICNNKSITNYKTQSVKYQL